MKVFKPKIAEGREYERWLVDVSKSNNDLDIDVFGHLQTAISLTLDNSHGTVEAIASGIIISLPKADSRQGKNYVIDNASNGDITVSPNGSDRIEGETSQTLPPNSCMDIYSNGTGWRIQ